MGIIEAVLVLVAEFVALLQPLFSALTSFLTTAGAVILLIAWIVLQIIRGINISVVAKKLNVKREKILPKSPLRGVRQHFG